MNKTLRQLNTQLEKKQSEHDAAIGQLSRAKTDTDIRLYEALTQKLEAELADLHDSISQLTDASEAVAQLSWKEEREIIVALADQHHIGYLVEDNKYVCCIEMNRSDNKVIINPQFRTVDATKFKPVLNKMAGRELKCGTEEIRRLFQGSNRDYYGVTASFNTDKWDNTKIYNKLDIIRRYWVQPDYDNADQYNIGFDFLMNTVCGGKAENIQHLESWIAYKWYHPQRNANMPNLDIGGYPGGNGKGRFIELLRTIFTHGCVVPAALKELTDGFNASWETAVILYYDEPATGELPEGKLKNATGGEEQRIEKKGVDAYTADRNYNMVFTSNNAGGVVKLAGTGSSGEDRRWSVMITDKVMVDEAMNTYGVDEETAKQFVNEINNLIKERGEVAKWLAHLITKYQVESMPIIRPLHGADYAARFEGQKDTVTAVFDALLPVFQQCGVITTAVLHEAVVALGNNSKITQRSVATKFDRYLASNRISAELVKKQRVKITWQGEESDVVQKTAFVMTSHTSEYALDYSLFSNQVYSKTRELGAEHFTITI